MVIRAVTSEKYAAIVEVLMQKRMRWEPLLKLPIQSGEIWVF
jgi:hypothetical protein